MSTNPLPSLGGGYWRATGRRALRALWALFIPALGAGLALRFLVPKVGSGLPGVVAVLGHRYPLLFGVALFLLFSSLTHYWAPRLLRARDASVRLRESEYLPKSRRRTEVVGFMAMIVGAVGAALGVRAFVRPFRVSSASMLPTLEPEDIVAGRMGSMTTLGSHAPSRGDIVVFRGAPVDPRLRGAGFPEILVKRVVGLPGDRIEMHGDFPVINGWPVPGCDAGDYLYVMPDTTGHWIQGRLRVEFLDDRAYLTLHGAGPPFLGTYLVKPGEVFVLGDNRGNSMDSRSYHEGRGGGVPLEAVDARAQWFLVGSQRNGDTDWGRLLSRVDSLQAHSRVEFQAQPLEDGIARCLRDRPTQTRPPPPDAALK